MDDEEHPRDTRRPRSVYSVGQEPDARFTLANERTFLAWVSFGLASMSLGVGLESFALSLQPALRMAASLLLILLGTFIPVQAWVSWKRIERALRLGHPLPHMMRGALTAVVIVCAGALVALAVVLE